MTTLTMPLYTIKQLQEVRKKDECCLLRVTVTCVRKQRWDKCVQWTVKHAHHHLWRQTAGVSTCVVPWPIPASVAPAPLSHPPAVVPVTDTTSVAGSAAPLPHCHPLQCSSTSCNIGLPVSLVSNLYFYNLHGCCLLLLSLCSKL